MADIKVGARFRAQGESGTVRAINGDSVTVEFDSGRASRVQVPGLRAMAKDAKALDSAKRQRLHRALDAVMDATKK